MVYVLEGFLSLKQQICCTDVGYEELLNAFYEVRLVVCLLHFLTNVRKLRLKIWVHV